MNLSIIIPCYNEELSIRKLVNNCIANISDGIEILLVDNNKIINESINLVDTNT